MTHKRGSMAIGPLSPKGSGAHYIPAREDFVYEVARVCNATIPSSQPLQLGKLWANAARRPGADDHQQFRSLGTPC